MKNIFTLIVCLFFISPLISQTQLTIAEARQVDAEGSLVNLGMTVELNGIAIGPNFRPGGHTWVLFDTTENLGITVFGFNNDVGYDVTDGDALRIVGELDEFNGLAEIIPEMIEVVSSGNAVPAPETVTTLNEQSEAKLIRLENVTLADPGQWGSSNFNVDLTDGNNTFQMRIDGDTDIAGMAAPTGSFNVVGIGGQFDNSEPYFNGYQIFPRSAMDIDPYDTGGSTGIEYERLTIAQAREVDLNGNAVRLGDRVEIQGFVHGMNIRPSGLQFTLIDETNRGIGVFSSANPFNYDYMEGDELILKGSIDQFNGLSQISPDSLFLISSGNPSVTPMDITEMNESVEGSLVTLQMVGWGDETDWSGDGSSFNIDFITLSGITQTMRIDGDTELANSMLPTPNGTLTEVTGVVGQFDSSEPYDEGYQLFPFRESDFVVLTSTKQQNLEGIGIYPNPVSDQLLISCDYQINSIEIFSMDGKRLMIEKQNQNKVNVAELAKATYLVLIKCDEGQALLQMQKQ